ncbi:MAG: 50S ribosomal protein L23 [Phycisphaerales bacterium]|nr:50S ribosomal protein L23 [Phycisphaerales bacterium]
MEAIHVIRRPLLTEKGTGLNEHNQYVFEVDNRARKPQIKAAIEELYKVRVVGVNTMVCRTRNRMTRYGLTPAKISKKAIVTLRDGDAIELF